MNFLISHRNYTDYSIYFKQRMKSSTDRRDTTWLRRRAFILSPLVINAAHYCFEARYFARFIATITNNGWRGMKTDKRELLPPRRSESKNFAEDVGWKRLNLSLSSWFYAIMSNLHLIVALSDIINVFIPLFSSRNKSIKSCYILSLRKKSVILSKNIKKRYIRNYFEIILLFSFKFRCNTYFSFRAHKFFIWHFIRNKYVYASW